MNQRKIESCIVTGATGMIGAHLVRLLLSKGIGVTAVIRPGSGKRDNLPEESRGLEIVECALADLGKGLAGRKADAFFHLAWDGTYGDARNAEEAQMRNVSFTEDALKAAAAAGCRVFVGAGSQAEYGFFEGALAPDTPMHPETAYGKAKKAAEERSREMASGLGIDHIWARILSVYGPYDNSYTLVSSALMAFLKGEEIGFTKGEQIWDYLYAGDCAEALYALSLSGKNGHAYPLGRGEKRLLRDYITAIAQTVSPGRLPDFGVRPYNDHQVMYLTADITDLINDTGYRPSTDFETGIRKTAEWMRGRIS